MPSERGLLMVTYSDLIQIGILIVGIIGLFFRPIKMTAGTLTSTAIISQATG